MYEEKPQDKPCESDDKTANNNVNNHHRSAETEKSIKSGIIVTGATAKWTAAQTENSLEDINITVTPGRLVAVIGPVGAGKVFLIFFL